MKNYFLIFIFFTLWFIAPILQFFEVTTSFFVGTAIVVFLFYLKSVVFDREYYLTKSFFRFYCLTIILLLIHTTISISLFSKTTNIERYISSLVFFFIFLYSAYLFANKLLIIDERQFNRAMKLFFVLLVGTSLFSLSGVLEIGKWPKYVFPYTEASHFALFFAPILFYVAVKAGKKKLLIILIGLLLALFVKNLTLLVAILVLLSALYRLQSLILLPVIAFIVFNNFELDYFTERVNFSKDNDNLSTLVYIQGWELMGEALKESSSFGVGFQQMGEVKLRRTPAGQIIYMLTKEDYNIPDAGFTAAKLICEFGIIGIILTFVFLTIFGKCWLKLGRKDLTKQSDAYIFAVCVVVSYFAEFMVRGVGYFNPTTFMMLASLFVINIYNKQKAQNIDAENAE